MYIKALITFSLFANYLFSAQNDVLSKQNSSEFSLHKVDCSTSSLHVQKTPNKHKAPLNTPMGSAACVQLSLDFPLLFTQKQKTKFAPGASCDHSDKFDQQTISPISSLSSSSSSNGLSPEQNTTKQSKKSRRSLTPVETEHIPITTTLGVLNYSALPLSNYLFEELSPPQSHANHSANCCQTMPLSLNTADATQENTFAQTVSTPKPESRLSRKLRDTVRSNQLNNPNPDSPQQNPDISMDLRPLSRKPLPLLGIKK